jgi:hypothetical protein
VLLVAEQDGVDADTAWPLADVLAVETPGRDFDQDDGVLVEDARDVAALRGLRETDSGSNGHPGLQLLLERPGVVVDAYLRDVLPEAFEVALD